MTEEYLYNNEYFQVQLSSFIYNKRVQLFRKIINILPSYFRLLA